MHTLAVPFCLERNGSERNGKASVHTRVQNGSGMVGMVIMCSVNEVIVS